MALQKTILKSLLKLPDRVLVALAGGKPLETGGRRMDARLQFMDRAAKRRPGLHTLTPQAARAAMREGLALVDAPPQAGVKIRRERIPGPDGFLTIRLYEPQATGKTGPGLVYFHMGGCVLGDLDTSDSFCATLAGAGKITVMSVDYRLGPEHKFPAAYDDAVSAFRWARKYARRLGMDEARLGVAGDSAGGNLSAAVCQALKASGEPQPKVQVLIYPAVDWASETPSMQTYGEVYTLPAPLMTWMRAHYLAREEDALDPRVSPLRARDLSGLAPAIVATAGFDPLADQGFAYAQALSAAGVKVRYRIYENLAHAFTAMAGAVPAAAAANLEIARMAKRELMA